MGRSMADIVAALNMFLLCVVLMTVEDYVVGSGKETLIWREGCKNATLLQKNTRVNFTVTNNYPGTCLDHCKKNNGTISYIALQGTSCRCIMGKVPDTLSTGCSLSCPGHGNHFCGSIKNNLYSLYKIDKTSSVSNSDSKCAYVFPNGSLDVGACNVPYKVFCIPASHIGCLRLATKTTWYDALNLCPSQSPYYSLASQKPLPCTTHVENWIGAFGRNAPPKNCSKDNVQITNGYTNSSHIADTADVKCANGFVLNGANISVCMANGSWVPDGANPVCSATSTTTLSTSSTSVTPTVKGSQMNQTTASGNSGSEADQTSPSGSFATSTTTLSTSLTSVTPTVKGSQMIQTTASGNSGSEADQTSPSGSSGGISNTFIIIIIIIAVTVPTCLLVGALVFIGILYKICKIPCKTGTVSCSPSNAEDRSE